MTGGRASRATVSVIVPTLNEEENIGWVLGRLPPDLYEVLVVDGRSTDETVAAAIRARPDVCIVHEPSPGKGAALRAGFALATGDFVVMIDADGSMDPAEIGRYTDMLEAGYDLVKGSRFLNAGGTDDMGPVRRFGNGGLLGLTNLLFGARFTELCYGYMALRRSALPRLRLTADGFEIESQIVTHAVRARLRIGEVPSFESERRSGESKLRTIRDGSRVLATLLLARSARWPSAAEILPPPPPLVASQPHAADVAPPDPRLTVPQPQFLLSAAVPDSGA